MRHCWHYLSPDIEGDMSKAALSPETATLASAAGLSSCTHRVTSYTALYQGNTLQCTSTLNCRVLFYYTALHSASELHCTESVHCTALYQCTILHSISALHCTVSVQYTALYQCITLHHNIELRCATLYQCTTLHCPVIVD